MVERIYVEKNSQIVLTDLLELYIIEMPKAKGKAEAEENEELDLWVKFIESPEEFDMGKANKEIKEAKEKLEEISQDEREQELAFQREIYIMDQKAIEEGGFDKGVKVGMEHGMKVGIERGMKNGIECGIKQNTIDTAKKMKNKNIAIDIISEITGLTKEEIENIE